MSIEVWSDWFRDTVTIERALTMNEYGERTYGAATSYIARISGKVTQVRDVTGEERVSRHQVLIATTAAITPADRLTLPSGYEPTQPPILAVTTPRDEQGPHHTRIFV